jgi:hypothetical protein
VTAAAWRAAADAGLLLHAGFVGFVVVGLALIVAGGARDWSWVRNPWFRAAHLAAIGVVVVQAWFGVICPLTTLEMMLRRRAGDATYAGGFVAHWIERALYWNAPPWVFAVVYTGFGAVVVGTWIAVRPRRFRPRRRTG